ncbi:adenylate/guanylate cyclase domain-containing protein [Sinimarinibacterium flocculans]|uniref:Adenylate cyclase n=1 Tax=Sinimarinibacterium flocculans TaxID=985250 RepID=A0A318EI51_9GAMM|nr:adenylate/guanylate cyclase domain-containing protein [Sinimarinibacterium flocculans]PXV68394.1 adenylate cyclase [Sinimarinibacterium flocculans]
MDQPGARQCGSCGTENPAGARFCNQCGSRLDAPARAAYTPAHLAGTLAQGAALQGERKRVTVLFADIKGSTRLAEQAGAELWHQVLDRFFGILARVVHTFEGTINQYTGDGIMALFGAPRALEDHAGHAAYAALQMQQEVRRYADELRLAHGLNLSMRVGLNSGEVVVGRIGDDLRHDYTAQGPTVNLAARVENICEPGLVYATCETARQIDDRFRLRNLGATQIPGVELPVEVFELEAAKSGLRTRLQRSLARSGSPFIGRDAELQRLTEALERARGGQGQVVTVVGNAGIGKSRLCHEFVRACERDGVKVHRSSGVPYASRLPMFPFRELLRSKLGVPDDAAPTDARRWIAGALLLESPDNAALLPPLFEFLGIGEHDDRTPDAAVTMQQRMLDELAQYLPCDEGPIILLIEDLHFLDHASEAFLPRLCEAVRGRACLLLMNHRNDYASEWLQPFVDEALPLTALRPAQLHRLASTLLGEDPSLEGVADIIVQRAAGNPYFVEEAVQALVDGGWLQGRPRAWTLRRPIDEWPLPDSVQALLAARIDRLPDALRARLQTAAVVGLEFDARILDALDASGDAEADLAALQDLGFVHDRDDGGSAFCHPLMQEVAYRGQLETRRRALHADLARLLASRCGGLDAEPSAGALAVALHWQRAGEWARAGAWNLTASRWLVSQDMPSTVEQARLALAHFDRAEESPEVLLGRIAARAALIRIAQFAPVGEETVERVYAEARALARRCGDVGADAELQISYGNELMHRGQVDAAAQIHEQAMDLCFAHGRAELINRFRVAVLITFNAAGRLRRIVEILDRAGGDWRTRAVDEENYLSRGFYGLMLAWMGRLQEASRHQQAAIEFAARGQRMASWIYASTVDLALLGGDDGGALMHTRTGLEQAEKFGSPFFRAVALRAHGLALSLNGRHAEALALLHEALPLVAKGALAHQFEANLLATLAQAQLAAGDEIAAEASARAARRSAQGAGSRIWEIAAWLAWLRLPTTAERRSEAVEGLQRVEALIDFCGAEGFRPWWHLARAHWATDAAVARSECRHARSAFLAIGAQVHAARLAQADTQERTGMRESA